MNDSDNEKETLFCRSCSKHAVHAIDVECSRCRKRARGMSAPQKRKRAMEDESSDADKETRNNTNSRQVKRTTQDSSSDNDDRSRWVQNKPFLVVCWATKATDREKSPETTSFWTQQCINPLWLKDHLSQKPKFAQMQRQLNIRAIFLGRFRPFQSQLPLKTTPKLLEFRWNLLETTSKFNFVENYVTVIFSMQQWTSDHNVASQLSQIPPEHHTTLNKLN